MKHKDYSILSFHFCLGAILLLFLFQELVAQPSTTHQNFSFDINKAEKEIEQRLRDYENALKKGDLVALGNLYTINAEILHDGRPSTLGRDNIVNVFEKMVRDSITSSSFSTTGLWGNNQILVEQGTGFFAHSTGKWVSYGNYLLVWKKVDGDWQIFRDTWFKKGDEK